MGRRAAPVALLPVFMPSPHLPRGRPCPEPPCPRGERPGSGGQQAPGAVPPCAARAHRIPRRGAGRRSGAPRGLGGAALPPGAFALTQFAPSARCRAWRRGPFIGAGAESKSARSLNPGRRGGRRAQGDPACSLQRALEGAEGTRATSTGCPTPGGVLGNLWGCGVTHPWGSPGKKLSVFLLWAACGERGEPSSVHRTQAASPPRCLPLSGAEEGCREPAGHRPELCPGSCHPFRPVHHLLPPWGAPKPSTLVFEASCFPHITLTTEGWKPPQILLPPGCGVLRAVPQDPAGKVGS